MAVPVVMPKQGQSVESCIIAAWKKQPGDPVRAGEVIAEVETDKAIVEVDSPADGVLLEIVHPVGADVPVMQVIAYVGTPGEAFSPAAAPDLAAAPASPPQAANGAEQSVREAPARTDAAPVSPRARQMAAAQGVDLTAVTGSGPRGRIIARDVMAAAVRRPKMTPVAGAMVAAGYFTAPASTWATCTTRLDAPARESPPFMCIMQLASPVMIRSHSVFWMAASLSRSIAPLVRSIYPTRRCRA